MATELPFPTINVVPAGFKWTFDASQKAAAKDAFIRVGGPQVTRRYLSGAKRFWTSTNPEENQTIFHTGYRITGTPDAIRSALHYAGISAEEIETVINTSITRDNYTTTRAGEYEQEIAAHAQAKQAKPEVEGYEWNQILWFGKNIKSAVITTKTGDQKVPVASPGRGGAGDTLADKLRKLGTGKVLDVSNMDINTGKGVRSVPAPKTKKSGKFGNGRVPIISNDLGKYIRAIELAYGPSGKEEYAKEINQVGQDLANVTVTDMTGLHTDSPRRKGLPLDQPGADLAQVPQFTTALPQVQNPTVVGTIGGLNLPKINALTGITNK